MLLPVKVQPWERKATRAVASGLSGGGEVIGLNGKRPVDDDAATKAPGEASSGAVMATHTRGAGARKKTTQSGGGPTCQRASESGAVGTLSEIEPNPLSAARTI